MKICLMWHVLTCHDVSLACEHLTGITFILGFSFMIHDMIGHGMTWGDIMMNSSHSHVNHIGK